MLLKWLSACFLYVYVFYVLVVVYCSSLWSFNIVSKMCLIKVKYKYSGLFDP